MAFIFENNVKTTLAATFTSGSPSLILNAETGVNNPPPQPLNGDVAALTLVDVIDGEPTVLEIIYYSNRTGTGPYTLTGLMRGQEGTPINPSWGVGTYAYQALTRDAIAQDTSSGDSNIDGGRADTIYTLPPIDGGGAAG